MDIFLKDHELEEVLPLKDSPDKARVINPGMNVKDRERINIPEERKEIIQNDALLGMSTRQIAEIHGIGKSTVANIVNDDNRAVAISRKHGIEDLAVAKLMETLNLLDPGAIDKERDKIGVINGLSQVIDRISGKDSNEKPVVHLHLYGPVQKKETDYETIEA